MDFLPCSSLSKTCKTGFAEVRLVQKIDPTLIGRKIRTERLKRGYTVEALGKLANYDISTISRMENGAALHLEKQAIVANILMIDVRELSEAGIEQFP